MFLKKDISFKFFKWRYFNDKYSFCYGAFNSSKPVANVGMKSIIINNKNNEIGFSRHSSMVLSDFRNLIFFLSFGKFHLQGINIVIMWPNNKNFANFNIKVKKNLIKRKLYLYRTNFHNINKKKN